MIKNRRRGREYKAVISVTASGRKVLELEGHDIVSMYGEHMSGHTVPTIVKDAATGKYHAEATKIKTGDTVKFPLKAK